jgi:peptide/nickel transport system permease protein
MSSQQSLAGPRGRQAPSRPRPRPVVGAGSVLRLPSARIALAVLAAVVFLMIFGSALAPQNPLTVNANALFQGPSAQHLLGTDYLGRDVLSRLMAGTRVSVLSAAEAVAIAFVLGAPLGIATVFLGRTFDFVVNRIMDALMTLPSIFFAVAVTAALGNGLAQAMLPVGILLAPLFFRVTRAATLEFSRAQYVEAAELLGGSKLHVIRVHVLRKVAPTMVVTAATAAAAALLAVSFLTFLGIGVTPPAPTWGGVLSSDLDYLSQAPWAPFIPGALIAVTVGALNALADAFRDKAPRGALVQPDLGIKTHSTLQSLEAADGRPTAA